MFYMLNDFHVEKKTIQFVVVFILWHFESFLLSVVVAIAVAAIVSTVPITVSISISTIVSVVGISRSVSRPLAVVVAVAAIGNGVASVAVVAKAIVAVVGISRRLGSRGRISGPLAIDNSTSDVRVASVAVMGAEAVDTVVRISLGSGSSIGRPLAVVVAITTIGVRVPSVAVVAEAIEAVVRISVGSGGRLSG